MVFEEFCDVCLCYYTELNSNTLFKFGGVLFSISNWIKICIKRLSF